MLGTLIIIYFIYLVCTSFKEEKKFKKEYEETKRLINEGVRKFDNYEDFHNSFKEEL